jgi:hypothetical protein
MTLESTAPPPVNNVNSVNTVPEPHCHQLGIDFAALPHCQ